ncbi:hypothetical protein HAX54_008344 [Datura stramonium]|uniref:Disease resistance N-terminal domain-containing protein n=1 Tax=Datura stramonium TaxID=4076 RepID=A0ABS8TFQ2_DATST|nr:hypothetical protein [Datura stramonium]
MKILSLSIEEAKSLSNCKKNLRMLKKYVSMIQALIHDAERRQVDDQAVKEWLKRLERVAKILNTRDNVVLCTISVVDVGGLGKTAVAKRIFNVERIKQNLEKRVWLCLSEISETNSFLELILESLTKRKVEVQSRDITVKTLQDELEEKNI